MHLCSNGGLQLVHCYPISRHSICIVYVAASNHGPSAHHWPLIAPFLIRKRH